MAFQIGDVVKLKSGGPKMTVTYIGPPFEGSSKITVWCNWFPAADNHMREEFPIEAVELVQED